MKVVILDAKTMGDDIDFSPITARWETVIYPSTAPEEVADRVREADVVLLNKVQLGAQNLAGAKRLRLICVFAVGYNNIDIDYCRARGIYVRNTPGYCTESVAQHTLAMLLALTEHLSYYDTFVKDGRYAASGVANHLAKPYMEIAGKTWGILGMGAIGRAVARLATAFGANVCYSSLSGVARAEDYPALPLAQLLATSDIVTIHAPLNAQTKGLIDAAALASMKKTAVLVNVGRGAVTDEAALAAAIDNGTIAGAAIDVFTEEPPRDDSPLMTLRHRERVLFTPHIAWASVEARRRCVAMTAENIAALETGRGGYDVWQKA